MDKESAMSGGAAFATTHWSAVRQARDGSHEEAAQAMARMCEAYWPPLFLFIRRRGHNRHDAEDLTQQFFEFLLQRDFLKTVDQSKGRFRSFLLASLKNFLNNQWHHDRRQKRGGGQSLLSLDDNDLDVESMIGAVDGTEDEVFDRDWAVHLLQRTMQALRSELAARGKEDHFEHLHRFLTTDVGPGQYEQLGDQLGMTIGAAKVAVHRLRARYRDLLLASVGETVAVPGEAREEAHYLLSVLRKTSTDPG